MDVILNYILQNKLFSFVLSLTFAYLLYRMLVLPSYPEENLVPHYKRFERREELAGDRRKQRPVMFADFERRRGERRTED